MHLVTVNSQQEFLHLIEMDKCCRVCCIIQRLFTVIAVLQRKKLDFCLRGRYLKKKGKNKTKALLLSILYWLPKSQLETQMPSQSPNFHQMRDSSYFP